MRPGGADLGLEGNITALHRKLAKLCAGMEDLFHLSDLSLTSLGGASGLAYAIYQVQCNHRHGSRFVRMASVSAVSGIG